jgi:hypothetical protein
LLETRGIELRRPKKRAGESVDDAKASPTSSTAPTTTTAFGANKRRNV